jgi:hypothetical protein
MVTGAWSSGVSTRPAAPVRAAVGIEEYLEPLGYVQVVFLRISMSV